MNIEDLIPPPVSFRAEPFGDVKIELADQAFGNWVEAGEKAKAWTDGVGFVRRLLAERAMSAPGELPLDRDALNGMGDDAVEAAAAALLAAGAHYFRVSLIADLSGRRRRVRVRRASEPYDATARAQETEAARLLRLVRDSMQDHRDHTTLILGPQLDAIDPFRQQAGLASVRQAIETQMGAAQSGPYLSAVDRIADSQRRRDLANLTEMSSAYLNSVDLERALQGAAAATAQLGAYPSVLASISDALPRDLFRTQEDLYRRGMRDAIETALGPRAAAAASIFQHLDFARDINRQFHLGLPAGVFAAAGLSALSLTAMEELALRPALFPPGFQVAAALGLQHRAPRGPVADVLQYYDGVDDRAAPTFASALDTVHAFDDDDADPPKVETFVVKFWALASALIANERDVVRRNGLMGIATFVLAMASVSAAIYYGEKTLEIARGGASAKDVAAQTAVQREILRELKGHGDASPVDPRVRYVHADAPLRAEPDGHALVLRIVYVDQTLRVVDERGAWVKVEVFDFHAERNVTGWINRRRLRLSSVD